MAGAVYQPPPGIWASTPARRLLWAVQQVERRLTEDPKREPEIAALQAKLENAFKTDVQSFPWDAWFHRNIVKLLPKPTEKDAAMTSADLESGGLKAPQQGLSRRRRIYRLPVAKADGHTGAAIMLYPPLASAEKLAVPGGEAPDELHITLAFLGDAADLSPEQRRAVLDVVGRWSSAPIFTAQLPRLAVFHGDRDQDGQDPLICVVDDPTLLRERALLVNMLARAGVPIDTTFADYKPHMTLAYVPTSDADPRGTPKIPAIDLSEVVVAFGDEVHDFRLGAVRKMLREQSDGWHVYSQDGTKHLGGPYATREQALARLAQVEHFKSEDDLRKDDTKLSPQVLAQIDTVVRQLGDDLNTPVTQQAIAARRAAVSQIIASLGLRFDPKDLNAALDATMNQVTGIDETTRTMLRNALIDTIERAATVEPSAAPTQFDFAREIRQLWGNLSQARAETIARTEYNRAASMATQLSNKDLGYRYKVWYTVGDDLVCPYCEANAAVGEIPIDDAFPSGDDAPPLHPNCRCNVASATGQGTDLGDMGQVAASEDGVITKYDPDQPRDDHGMWTDTGEAVGAAPSGPRPSLSEGSDYAAYQRAAAAWDKKMTTAVALGKVTPEEAQKRGWSSNGPISEWKPLPPTLLHVTTAADAVMRDGLKVRDDVEHSGGIGGGVDNLVSFTTDPKYADAIQSSLLDMRKVATGERTAQDILDEARKLDAARTNLAEPSIEKGIRANMNPDLVIRGVVLQRSGLDGKAPTTPGEWRPVQSEYHWTGGDGVERYTVFERPMTHDEKISNTGGMQKAFSVYREAAGGQPDVMVFGDSWMKLKDVSPDQIRVLQFSSKPGTLGAYQGTSESEYRTVPQAVTLDKVVKYSEDQPRDEAGRWTDGGGAPSVALPASYASRYKDGFWDYERDGKITPRGAPIKVDDPRIPAEVYHVTTAGKAVESSGILRASGAGGLGGDDRDRIVSFTVDKGTAEQLQRDLKTAITAQNEPTPDAARAYLNAQSQREGFDFAGWPTGSGYNIGDHLRAYFIHREDKTGATNPMLFSTENLKGRDPADVKLVSVPKQNLDTGALITDFDLGKKYGLNEIRIYGDVPLKGAVIKYDESQPRDEAGRWTDGGGAGGADFGIFDRHLPGDSGLGDDVEILHARQTLIHSLGLDNQHVDGAAIDELRSYKGEDAPYVNRALRGSRFTTIESEQGAIDKIDKAIRDVAPLKQDVTVFRGFGTDSTEEMMKWMKPGNVIRDPAYVSTTLDPKLSRDFALPLQVAINVPAGTKALYMEPYKRSGQNEEMELLLPRDSQFKVLAYKPRAEHPDPAFYDPPRVILQLMPPVRKYDDSQPRDEQGRWTAGDSTKHLESRTYHSTPPDETGSADYARKAGWVRATTALTADQKSALGAYKFLSYKGVNTFLRTPGKLTEVLGHPATSAEQATLKSAVDKIDSAFAKVPPIGKDTTVYRVVPDPATGREPWAKTGAIIEDKAFVSTTVSRIRAESMLNTPLGGKRGGTMFTVDVPREMKGIWMEHGLPNEGRYEGELLLPRGTQFKVMFYMKGRGSSPASVGLQALPPKGVRKYSEDQPRDEQGRWTTGGGSAAESVFVYQRKPEGGWMATTQPASSVWTPGRAPAASTSTTTHLTRDVQFRADKPEHPVAYAKIHEFEDAHRSDPKESAMVVDRRGNVILTKEQTGMIANPYGLSGGQLTNGISFTDAEVKTFRGALVSHNHPSGQGPSNGDLILMRASRIGELRVARNGDGTTRVSLTPKARAMPVNAFIREVRKTDYEVHNILAPRVRAGMVPLDMANEYHHDAKLNALAGKGLITVEGVKPVPKDLFG